MDLSEQNIHVKKLCINEQLRNYCEQTRPRSDFHWPIQALQAQKYQTREVQVLAHKLAKLWILKRLNSGGQQCFLDDM
jgi:hypothetical protein